MKKRLQRDTSFEMKSRRCRHSMISLEKDDSNLNRTISDDQVHAKYTPKKADRGEVLRAPERNGVDATE